jgi:hypothetical protein
VSEAVHPSVPDPEGLIARLRAEEPEALQAAYRIAFGGEIGRYVMAHILADAGLARHRGWEPSGERRAYHDGGVDRALAIMKLAGFDQYDAAVTTLSMSDQMQGREHERSSFSGPDERPILDGDDRD